MACSSARATSDDFEVVESQPADQLRIFLRYSDEGTPAIQRLYRVSKPGRRVYRGADDIKPVLNGLGVALVSTSRRAAHRPRSAGAADRRRDPLRDLVGEERPCRELASNPFRFPTGRK